MPNPTKVGPTIQPLNLYYFEKVSQQSQVPDTTKETDFVLRNILTDRRHSLVGDFSGAPVKALHAMPGAPEKGRPKPPHCC